MSSALLPLFVFFLFYFILFFSLFFLIEIDFAWKNKNSLKNLIAYYVYQWMSVLNIEAVCGP